ncbi:MAG: D-aminoacyl-tRNA deacylase [Atopobiaceae bacterium]|jgi:D-tyrosyl-tRNA(Tyr) deacylase
MRALLQRVSSATCTVDGEEVGSCQMGYLILLGVGPGDDKATADLLWDKIYHLRIFTDAAGKTNLSLADIDGEVLVVSQFTLYADCRKGRRPSFNQAAAPDVANELYEYFCERAAADAKHVGHGIFGADMSVTLTNSGPFTIWLDTDELTRPR